MTAQSCRFLEGNVINDSACGLIEKLDNLQTAHRYEIINEFTIVNRYLNNVWVLISVVMIFSMQLGFAMLEVGIVRAKNSRNIIVKNLVDTFISGVAYWFVGFGMSQYARGGLLGAGTNIVYGGS